MIKVTFDNGETYTEKEFKRDLKRYFDTLDKDQYPCKFYEECEKCMFFKHSVCGKNYVRAVPINYSFKIMEKVYRWAKAHPVKTNRDKLEEVFGVEVAEYIITDGKQKTREYKFSNKENKTIRLNSLSLEDTSFSEWLDEEYKEPHKETGKEND